ncbi:hypothetical protein BV22DRAFT_1102947 [Leucogyrophana mollusca]|uniref:Uncharacterized protein n=1 Tax=Leucogyrophana mollusca TaxID=85980 RepID=A0ACB8BR97_9AGAM|nr:hypothetical protein BV22DRAFT_1102947 [Leucogyrophana mollusca]
MTTIPAPTVVLTREEWPDADFDLPEGDHIRSLDVESDREDDDDMDWDAEMDLGQTGGAKAKAVVAGMAARSEFSRRSSGNMITIRPPLTCQEEEDEEDDEGVSTIKVAALPKFIPKPQLPPTPIEEDMESAFALPSDLTQLSLAPLPLSHRSSKNSLEWGDRDQTSSSQSSDAYSTLGFADASPSSNSASSVSLPYSEESECDEEDEGDLEGLVIPSGLFESGQSGKHLKKMLEMKKKAQITEQRIKVASPDPEDDFETGLVIEDDEDFSPSRLAKQTQRFGNRSKSAPARSLISTRPPSRLRGDRAKSPVNPPVSSARQLQRIKLSSSPPPRPPPPTRAQTYKEALSSAPPTPPTPTFLSPKPGSLRGQKSHSGLKPPTPPSTQRKGLTRKASLSSLMESSTSQASGSGMAGPSTKLARYEAPTAASRAKSHTSSTSRIHALDFIVPPTRPSTPSSNPAALRLTMPTSMRMKSRPALSSVFPGPPSATSAGLPPPLPTNRATSPLPPRPPSSLSLRSRNAQSQTPPVPSTSAPKLLRRPKRQRTYGDGTELDGIDDLPTDREKEGRFRVQPKAGSRIPTSVVPKPSEKDKDKGTMRKKGRRDAPSPDNSGALAPATNTLRRTGRIEFPSKTSGAELSIKKKKDASSPVFGHTRRKPTLIRHLGSANGPKVVGEMKWNPSTLRWEGNDQVLRDFDAVVGTSTRPALITHLTGSSIGSPVGSFAAGARKVGNMIFDPTRMCWISTLPPDEEEPDVFADLADDEEDGDGWETKGGTIRAIQQACAGVSAVSDTSGSSLASAVIVTAPSPAPSRTRTNSESESDRGSRASIVYDVDDDFVERCRAAEERHRTEMRGWRTTLSRYSDPFGEPDRQDLYEIRALATRKY